MRIRVAQIKVYPEKGQLEANYSRLLSVLTQVADERPDVVVTPECFLDGYVVTEDAVSKENLARYGIDPATSLYARDVAGWARQHDSWFILGCTRVAAGGVFNTALIYDRAGSMVGAYNKVHCQTHDHKFTPGDRLPVFGSDFGPFGAMICADRRWPETVRTLALKGARVIFNPTYGMHDNRNLHLMQTRSYESEVFIAFTHPGQALLTGPSGEIVCNQESAEVPFTVTEIDLDEVDRVRCKPSAHLRDRRPEVYELG